MLVRDIMTRKVVALGPDLPIKDVLALMAQRQIRHFPILDDGCLVGIVSDRDLRTVGGSHPSSRPDVELDDPVRDIMAAQVVTARPLDPVEEAARILCKHKIGAMPVVEGSDVVGIVTATDLLSSLMRMTGVAEASARLDVELSPRPGALVQLLDSIASRNHRVSSLLTLRREADIVQVALRVDTLNGSGLAEELRREGFDILWPTPVASELADLAG